MSVAATQKKLLDSISLDSLEDIDDNDKDDFTYQFPVENEYMKICKKLNIPIITSFIENIGSNTLNLAHRGIGDTAIRGITFCLKTNIRLIDIDFTDNNLGVNGAISVGKIFKDNYFIERLNLSCNQIGNDGLMNLLNCTENSNDLKYLNVSDNQINDKAAEAIGRFLISNKSVKEFDLSKNNLSEMSGRGLRQGLEGNTTLEILDLSWNKLHIKTPIEIANSLLINRSLRKLNLAWNGYDDEASISIGESLCVNDVLVELDLSSNRISDRGAKGIAHGLTINKTLQILHLKGNTINTDGIQSLLESCLTNKKTDMHTIDLQGIWVNEKNKETIQTLERTKSEFAVPVGGYIRTIDKFDLRLMRNDLIAAVKEYIAKNRLRVVDLFNQWDKDKSYTMRRTEFRKGLQTCMPSFSNYQIDMLIQWFDPNNTDAVDYREFVELIV